MLDQVRAVKQAHVTILANNLQITKQRQSVKDSAILLPKMALAIDPSSLVCDADMSSLVVALAVGTVSLHASMGNPALQSRSFCAAGGATLSKEQCQAVLLQVSYSLQHVRPSASVL